MKTYIITGGAGFIGSNLIDKLINDNHIICVDNFNDYYSPMIKLDNIKDHMNKHNFYLHHIDITDKPQLEYIFKKYKIDAVIHLAARAGVRPSINNPSIYFETNVNGTLNLLELCRQYEIRKFVYASSSSVYGLNKTPFKEDQKINPISPYAASKISSEKLCQTYSHLYDMSITCLRFFTVYGKRQRPDLAIAKFFKHIKQGRPIPVFGDGSTSRDYTYIDDILNGIISAISYDTKFDIFNLGNDSVVRLKDLIFHIEKTLNIRAIINRQPEQPGDVPITYANIDKARELLNYNPQIKIREGLKKYKTWLDNQ